MRVNKASLDECGTLLFVCLSHSQFLVTSVTKYDVVDARDVSDAINWCVNAQYLMVQP